MGSKKGRSPGRTFKHNRDMSCQSVENLSSNAHMAQESAEIDQEHKVIESAQSCPNLQTSKERPPESDSSSRCMIFTYFKGDINSMVDEHFSRALNRQTDSRDDCSKSKNESVDSKKEGRFSTNHWNPSPTNWANPYQAPLPSTVTRSPANLPGLSNQYTSVSLHNPHPHPPDMWHFPAMSNQSTLGTVYRQPISDLHRVMSPAMGERQYSPLLVPLQCENAPVGPNQGRIIAKPDLSPTWSGRQAGLPEMRQNMNPDTGFQHQEKRKDMYWY
eukprot:gi/632935681/ref/XP_007890898.1/ PREDICTED: transcription cofactor vestigial-like protein 1 [Callorhinchus milii]